MKPKRKYVGGIKFKKGLFSVDADFLNEVCAMHKKAQELLDVLDVMAGDKEIPYNLDLENARRDLDDEISKFCQTLMKIID